MENWITDIMNEFGYVGICLLIALENIFPPIPSEVILTLGGFMTTYSGATLTGVIIASTLGSVLGAIILYGIGMLLDVGRLERIIGRWGRFLRLTNADIRKADGWFRKYGVWAVFLCRLIPLIRSLISIPAGMSRMNIGLFLLFTTLGSLIWNIILASVGAAVGSSWETIVGYMDIYSKAVYVLLAILSVLIGVFYLRKRKSLKSKINGS